MKQASAGIWNLHSSFLVHRDLALRNLLIDLKRLRIVVTDFGLSRFVENFQNSGETASRIMPIYWSAPESLNDQKFNNKSDIWSFGVLCWELLN
eukprot:UN26102